MAQAIPDYMRPNYVRPKPVSWDEAVYACLPPARKGCENLDGVHRRVVGSPSREAVADSLARLVVAGRVWTYVNGGLAYWGRR